MADGGAWCAVCAAEDGETMKRSDDGAGWSEKTRCDVRGGHWRVISRHAALDGSHLLQMAILRFRSASQSQARARDGQHPAPVLRVMPSCPSRAKRQERARPASAGRRSLLASSCVVARRGRQTRTSACRYNLRSSYTATVYRVNATQRNKHPAHPHRSARLLTTTLSETGSRVVPRQPSCHSLTEAQSCVPAAMATVAPFMLPCVTTVASWAAPRGQPRLVVSRSAAGRAQARHSLCSVARSTRSSSTHSASPLGSSA